MARWSVATSNGCLRYILETVFKFGPLEGYISDCPIKQATHGEKETIVTSYVSM